MKNNQLKLQKEYIHIFTNSQIKCIINFAISVPTKKLQNYNLVPSLHSHLLKSCGKGLVQIWKLDFPARLSRINRYLTKNIFKSSVLLKFLEFPHCGWSFAPLTCFLQFKYNCLDYDIYIHKYHFTYDQAAVHQLSWSYTMSRSPLLQDHSVYCT
jgi:hypothetical protein